MRRMKTEKEGISKLEARLAPPPSYAAMPMKLPSLLLACLAGSLFAQEKPEATEYWTPVPRVVEARENRAPSDALVLLGDAGLSEWSSEKGTEASWDYKDGVLSVRPGAGTLVTRRSFDDCQLHIEWRSPAVVQGDSQNRGNSGIFLQGRYEVQVLDSRDNPTYVNGQAASVYKQSAPLVNASRGPGEWQTYDIVFHAPRFNADGSLRRAAVVTVLHNGVLVQDHFTLAGPTAWIGTPPYEAHAFKQPLTLQDHGCPVSYRNIWIRELDTQATETLLAGDSLTGWYSFLEKHGRDSDPNGNFSMHAGVLRIIGRDFGYLATQKEYSDYHLRAEFRWGDSQWAPRETGKRDSGILYHFPAETQDHVWPKSVECQVQEGDCGDIWFVGTEGRSPNRDEQAWGMKHVFRSADFEAPKGGWNTIEVVCIGGHIEHYVNGHLVNSADSLSVNRGKILLQSEGAEVFYRNVRLTPLN